jgi:outer membrane lipoprotein SlyB
MKASTVRPASLRVNPIIAGVVVSVMILSLIGVGAITRVAPDAHEDAQPAQAASPPAPAGNCALCGTVESIWTVAVRGEPAGAGAAAGGFAGAAIGNQTGREAGNAAMTMLGAAGGFFAGNELAKKHRAYRVTVRMEDGSFRTVSLSSPPAFNVGDKVRVIEGRLVRA